MVICMYVCVYVGVCGGVWWEERGLIFILHKKERSTDNTELEQYNHAA